MNILNTFFKTFTFGKSGNVAEILWDKQEILKRISNIRKNIEKSSSYIKYSVRFKCQCRCFPELLDATKNVHEGLVLKSLVAAEGGSGE